MGFSLAGLVRQFLVYRLFDLLFVAKQVPLILGRTAPQMIWPDNLYTIALNSAFHRQKNCALYSHFYVGGN
jgi:hypothetical protein